MATAAQDTPSLRNTALTSFKRLREEYYNTGSSKLTIRTIISPLNTTNYLQMIPSSAFSVANAAEMIPQMSFFDDLYHASDYKWIGTRQGLPYSQNQTNIIPIVRPILSLNTQEHMGWLYTEVSASVITDAIHSFPLEADSFLYITIGTERYLYSPKDKLLIANSQDYEIIRPLESDILQTDTASYEVRMDNGKKGILITRSLGIPDWHISQVMTANPFSHPQMYLSLFLTIFLMILTLGIIMTYLLNRIINQPIRLITKKLLAISQGDFSPDDSIEWNHEFGEIGKGINLLSRNVVNLMNTRLQDERQKADLEYQILQSQINPHFLYNTLNSIKIMALMQGANGISEMTTSLARLLKNVSKGSSSLITLKEELALLKDYLVIQEYRYGGGISVTYDIEGEQLLDYYIHRFTLQPIIENSLFHGIEPKGGVGKIRLKITEIASGEKNSIPCLFITVNDDGIGMDSITIKTVLEGTNETSKLFFKKVGISNVNQRIRHSFGTDYGLTIESTPGKGTQVEIKIPCLPETATI
ncbi:MAG: sensor histidine kinase [Lachnospiraceae bacterium]